jgi:hypothetical protein
MGNHIKIVFSKIHCKAYSLYLRRFLIVSCRDPLLGNDRDINNETTPANLQQILDNYNRGTVFSTWSVTRCKQDNLSNETVMSIECLNLMVVKHTAFQMIKLPL